VTVRPIASLRLGAVLLGALALSACGTSAAIHQSTTTSTSIARTVISPWVRDVSHNASTSHNVLNAVTYIKTRAWAVGDFFNGTSDQTLTEQLTNGSWTVVTSPNATTKHNELDSVSGVSSNDVWAVGRYAPLSGQERTLIEHWNGTQWSIVASPNVGAFHNELDGVVARSANDVWAVGHYDSSSLATDHALIEHWNGRTWQIERTPAFLGRLSDLSSVAAAKAGGPVWAVGSETILNRSITLVLEYEGGIWRIQSSPNRGPYSNVLQGVTATTANNAWAVGNDFHNGSSFAVIEHWDSKDWDLQEVPKRLTHHYVLSSVATDTSGRAYAVGNYFAGHADIAVVLQWTGAKWVLASSPIPGTLHNELLGVATRKGATPLAVGKYFSGTADRTLTVRCQC
jgi:hypothetical protein